MGGMNRRDFLRTSAAGTGALVAAPTTRILGANDRINVAVAGIHGRGRSHYRSYAGMDGVEVSHLVDPDARLFDSRAKDVEERQGRRPETVQDIRDVLDKGEVDAVSIATCNHWHALMTYWACEAGKDVYVEKPMSHNVHEGRIAVEAARKHNRVVQHGTQRRSSRQWHKEVAAVQSGKYGKLLVSKGYCCKPRWSIGFKPTKTPPSSLDFDTWLGPAPDMRYHGNLVHYNWHWFWETGNGDIGNQGVHQMDIARWAIGKTLPKRVFSLGGRLGYVDQGETPNTEMAVYDYGDTLLLFEVRGLVGKKGFGRVVDNEFYTTEGKIRDGKFHPKDGSDPEPLDDFDVDVEPGGNFGNFINVVRSRKTENLNAEIEVGHYSAALCHLGNISYRLGVKTPWERKPEAFSDNKQVQESWKTIEENLAGVGVPLDKTAYRLGRVLDFDPESETFVNAPEANRLLSRAYRPPFVVPDKV